MSDYVIRPYSNTDREAVIGLINELNNHEAAAGARRRIDRIAAIDCFEDDSRKAAEDGGQIVLETKDGVIGYSAYRFSRIAPFVPGAFLPEVHIENIVVGAAARGRGYGQILLRTVEEIARAKGAIRMTLGVVPGNDIAMKAYERFGFSPIAVEMERLLDDKPSE
jgi:ribosomal protein S18 acetylase RimI-like enzyme